MRPVGVEDRSEGVLQAVRSAVAVDEPDRHFVPAGIDVEQPAGKSRHWSVLKAGALHRLEGFHLAPQAHDLFVLFDQHRKQHDLEGH